MNRQESRIGFIIISVVLVVGILGLVYVNNQTGMVVGRSGAITLGDRILRFFQVGQLVFAEPSENACQSQAEEFWLQIKDITTDKFEAFMTSDSERFATAIFTSENLLGKLTLVFEGNNAQIHVIQHKIVFAGYSSEYESLLLHVDLHAMNKNNVLYVNKGTVYSEEYSCTFEA